MGTIYNIGLAAIIDNRVCLGAKRGLWNYAARVCRLHECYVMNKETKSGSKTKKKKCSKYEREEDV